MTTNSIETERLLIRSTREEDGEFCLGIWLDEEMGKYLSDPPRDRADEAELHFAEGIEEQEGWYPFVAELKATGERIATCSLVPGADGKTWGLGYCVHKKYWRQGFATEMLTALIRGGCRRGIRTFTASVAKENAGSNAVLRKLGFSVEKEGSFRKRGTEIVYPEYVYRLDLEQGEF